jgi:hypothetical protein
MLSTAEDSFSSWERAPVAPSDSLHPARFRVRAKVLYVGALTVYLVAAVLELKGVPEKLRFLAHAL